MEMCQTAQLCQNKNLWTTWAKKIVQTYFFKCIIIHYLYLLLWIQLLNFSYMVHECSKVYWKQYYRLLLLWATIVLSMSSIVSRLTKVSSITQCIWCTNIWSYTVYHPQMVIKPVRICSSIWSATNLKWCIKIKKTCYIWSWP